MMKVKRTAGATCYLAILNTTEHLHPRAVLDAKPPPVSSKLIDDGTGCMLVSLERMDE